MKSHVFLLSLLAGGIGIAALTAREQPRQSTSNDLAKVNQPREEKLERPSPTLLARCQKMLAMQIAVSNGTRSLHKVIEGTADKKPRPKDRQAALKLARDMENTVKEATKALDVLEAAGAGAAFLEVFGELRKDMKRAQRRLKVGDVGLATQAIEAEIIDTLKEMIASLQRH